MTARVEDGVLVQPDIFVSGLGWVSALENPLVYAFVEACDRQGLDVLHEIDAFAARARLRVVEPVA